MAPSAWLIRHRFIQPSNAPRSIEEVNLHPVEKVSNMLLHFIRNNKPPWEIVRRIYSAVIVLTAGFQCQLNYGIKPEIAEVFERKVAKKNDKKSACFPIKDFDYPRH